MAHLLPPRVFALLRHLAEPLIETALQEAEPLAHIGDGATGEDIARSIRVQAVTLSVQALLRADPLDGMSDFDTVMALAAVCGTVLAQVGMPSAMYRAFNAQMAAVLKEVGDANTPHSEVLQ